MSDGHDQISDLSATLRKLYEYDFQPVVRGDPADPHHTTVAHIERSVALLANELQGDLLDVGCGQKPYADYFRHAKSYRGCDYKATKADLDFICPAHTVPLPDGSIDGIICTEVLEHVPDPRAVWTEFGRLVRPGGHVLLSTPMYWPHHEAPYDFFRFTGYGLQRLVEDSGFELRKIYPRGGTWIFVAQAVQHTMVQYLPFRWQRVLLNRIFLTIDRWRCDVRVTVGWTILARKR